MCFFSLPSTPYFASFIWLRIHPRVNFTLKRICKIATLSERAEHAKPLGCVGILIQLELTIARQLLCAPRLPKGNIKYLILGCVVQSWKSNFV